MNVPPCDAPLVSVVSLTYNRRASIAELLAALRHQTYPRFEVIVVDNCSTDGTAEMIRRDFPEVRLIETGSNLGMVAYNLGFEAARGDYILVMDDDGLPGSPDWIAQVVERFEANPRLGAVCCTIRMRDTGRIAHDSPQFAPEGDAMSGYPAPAYNGTGAGLRRVALRERQTYPDWFGIMYLELHLCTKLLEAEWGVRHFPEIETWHNRLSGSSFPSISLNGLRNYYWYVWELYPWPQVLIETLHELGSRIKLTLQGRIPFLRFWRATRDAFLGMGQARQHRRPILHETLRYLRWVRRQGNWHGIAPEVRAFDWDEVIGAHREGEVSS